MEKNVQAQLNNYTKERKTRKHWKTVVASLCAVVAVGTAYTLINPASTQQQEVFCGFEEHAAHTDACYGRKLICELPEEGHTHTEACYEESRVLTCGFEDTAGHVHTEACYETEEYYSCGLEETDGHSHTEACYGTDAVLICPIEENHVHSEACYDEQQALVCGIEEGHVHSEACFEYNPVLICGQEECAPHHHNETCISERQVLTCTLDELAPHEHTDACWTTEKVLVCGLQESAPHEHTDACYSADSDVLICELPIHEHTLQCFSNPEADLEDAAGWEQSFRSVELTGHWDEDVLAIARTQVGYTESTRNYHVLDDGSTMQGYTRYGAWYGDPYGEWCAMFCSFCLDYAGVDRAAMPRESSCVRWVELLSSQQYDLYRRAEEYSPVPGDLIFFDWNGVDPEHPELRVPDHVGFVAEVTADDTGAVRQLTAIEGNNGESVCANSYDITDSRILGYASLPENPAFWMSTIESAPASDGAVAVVSGRLPEGAVVQIEAVELTEEELIAFFGEEEAEVMTGFVAYDITILVNGEEWQPDETVNVTIRQPNIELTGEEDLSLSHVTGDSLTDVEVTTDGTDVNFAADGFSIYILHTTATSITLADSDTGITVTGILTGFDVDDLTGSLPLTDGPAAGTVYKISLHYLFGKAEISVPVPAGTTYDHLWLVQEDGTLVPVEDAVLADRRITFTTKSHTGTYVIGEGTKTRVQDPETGVMVESDGTELTVVELPGSTKLDDMGISGYRVYDIKMDDFTGYATVYLPLEHPGESVWYLGQDENDPCAPEKQDITVEWYDDVYYAKFVTTHFSDWGVGTDNVSYWKQCTAVSDISSSDVVMIVKDSYALTVSDSGAVGSGDAVKVAVAPVVGSDGVYTISGNGNFGSFTWQFVNPSGTGKLTNTRTGLSLAMNNSTAMKLSNNGAFIISTTANGSTCYLSESNGSFRIGSNTNNAGMTIYKQVDAPQVSHTVKTTPDGKNSNTVYTIDVFGFACDSEGSIPTGAVPVFLGTVTVNSNTTSSAPVVPANAFKNLVTGNSELSDATYVSAYYGTESAVDKDNVTALYRYGSSGTRYLGVKYNGGSDTTDQYLSASDPKALYIRFIQGKGSGESGLPDLTPKTPDHSKYIDAFRDGEDNPDTDLDDKARNGELTDDIFDLYRLYLDVGPETAFDAVDVFFIIDSSTSMCGFSGYDAKDVLGQDAWRCWALDTLLNGQASGTQSAPSTTSYTGRGTQPSGQHQTTLNNNGLISMIAALNPNNKIAVARFSATSQNLMEWTAASSASAISYTNVSGTNYVAGLQRATAFLNQVTGEHEDGNKKVMVFLSDGLPTKYYTSLDDTGTPSGSGKEDSDAFEHTRTMINTFKGTDLVSGLIDSGDLEIYCIQVGSGKSNTDPSLDATELLKLLSTNDTAYNSTNFQILQKIIDAKITRNYGHYSKLKVTEPLSAYVDFYTDQLDMKVEKIATTAQGTSVTLYENGAVTTAGLNYLEPNGVTWSEQSRTVTVDFLDTYQEEGGYIYRLSFNVKTNQHAYDTYVTNVLAGGSGYDKEGDITTDYPDNNTSSNRPGFFSNDGAALEFAQARVGEVGVATESPYLDPVIQVRTAKLTVTKTWTDGASAHADDSVSVDVYMKALPDGYVAGDTLPESFRTGGTKVQSFILDDADGTAVTAPLVLNAENNWTLTVTNLPRGYCYYIVEQDSDDLEDYRQIYEPSAVAIPHTAPESTTFALGVTNKFVKTRYLVLKKVDMMDNSPLSGADFKLYSDEARTTEVTPSLVTSGTDGVFTPADFVLEPGEYYLHEEQAPAGYDTLTQDVRIVVDEDNGITAFSGDTPLSVSSQESADGKSVTYTLAIANSSGYVLPKTGGIGTTIFYAVGTVLLLGSAVLLISRRRRNK